MLFKIIERLERNLKVNQLLPYTFQLAMYSLMFGNILFMSGIFLNHEK